MLKPHRVLVDKVNLYADEAAAFLRRRRHSRREYVRIEHRDGTGLDLPVGSERAAAAVAAARRLLGPDGG
ncbi:MAG: hypothetical protein M9938_07340 [Solirubrobacterales bacterium]|nr:hypothetical protein [Solirubrobacterales bacterium]